MPQKTRKPKQIVANPWQVDLLGPLGRSVAKAVRDRVATVGIRTACIEPGSPREKGCGESVDAKLRDGLLNGEVFGCLAEAKTVIESWRLHYTTTRPH